MSQLDKDGKIPAFTECPFENVCCMRNCNHLGKEQSISFSCASARGFDMIAMNEERKRK